MFPLVLLANRWRQRLEAVHAEAYAQRAARDEAERLNQEKSRFLAMMSHELRTPLNSILGFAQLLKLHLDGSLSDRQVRYVDNIESSGHHLLTLINEILDLSKIEAGKLEVADEEFALDHVISSAVDVAQPLADAKSIALSVSGHSGTEVRGDPMRVTQVLMNLLSNAVKFSNREGRIDVVVTATDGSVAIDVADTGAGIAPEEQKRIFEEFVQLNDARSRANGGTGLGLPISARLARLMGGELRLVSSGADGSVFRLTLRPAASKGLRAATA